MKLEIEKTAKKTKNFPHQIIWIEAGTHPQNPTKPWCWIGITDYLDEKEAQANAAELVKRWNAFEEGGSHDALVEAWEKLFAWDKKNPIRGKCTKYEAEISIAEFVEIMKQAKAALAAVKE